MQAKKYCIFVILNLIKNQIKMKKSRILLISALFIGALAFMSCANAGDKAKEEATDIEQVATDTTAVEEVAPQPVEEPAVEEATEAEEVKPEAASQLSAEPKKPEAAKKLSAEPKEQEKE